MNGLDLPLGLLEVEALRISRESARESSNIVNFTHRLPLPPPPMRYPWYSFLLEAESTSGSQCDRKVYVNEKFQ